MSMVASMKRKKGKKKEAAAAPDLSRILGYTPPNDVPAESDRCGVAPFFLCRVSFVLAAGCCRSKHTGDTSANNLVLCWRWPV
jgi:hypothetical protein